MRKKIQHICSPYFMGFLITIIYNSCEVINPDEPIPSYIKIDQINLQTNYSTQGSNSHNIVDAWVFVNDQIVGGYELPALIPVLKSGNVDIKIKGGIKNSGISGLRREYPFYNFYQNSSVELLQDSVITISPTVTYFNELNFEFIEDFEGGTYIFSASTTGPPMQITYNSSEVIEGNASLKINVNDSAVFRAITPSYILPKGGTDIYLEMDYMSTGYIEVRVLANTLSTPIESSVIILYPTQEKKKIYIDLGPSVSEIISGISYQIILLSYNAKNQSSSVQIIDNVKLVHPSI